MMKRKISISILLMIVLISGCGKKEQTESSDMQISTIEMQEYVDTQVDSKEETGGPEEEYTELNYHRADIKYEDEFPVKLILASGENVIFMMGRNEEGRSLYKMNAEDSTFEKLDIAIPEELGAKKMVVDTSGNCHILMMSVKDNRLSYETMQMWIVDSDGILVEKKDFSDEVKMLNPFCLAIDKDGFYYMDSLGKNIYKIDEQGELCNAVGIESVEGIGIGEDNSLYVTVTNQEGKGSDLYCLVGEELEKKEAELPFSLAKYSDLYPGRKNEIVIFSETAGVLVYNSENQILEHVITDFPCSSQDMIGYGMLADGRFVCVYEENKETYFSYIPIYEEEN